MTINVRIFSTGQCSIRPSILSQPADRPVILRRLAAAVDRSWSEWLPIHVFLVEHAEGNILFDVGCSHHCTEAGYFPWWAPINMVTKFEVKDSDDIGPQLKESGIDPSKLKAVVLSHLHHDHSGGLGHVIGSPVYVNKEHWEAFGKSPVKATLEGICAYRWPKDFEPRFLDPNGPAIGPFEKSYPITSDGKVVVVDTPGHVPGHVSLIVYGDEATYFLPGDATYSLDLLDKEQTDGANENPLLAVETVRKIKQFCRSQPTILLPAHDPGSMRRLEEKTVYSPTDL